MPVRQGNQSQQLLFTDILTSSNTTELGNTTPAIAHQAAELRVKYNLKLPGAVQVATAIAANSDALLTNDTQLKRVTELAILVLRELQP